MIWNKGNDAAIRCYLQEEMNSEAFDKKVEYFRRNFLS